MISVELLAVYAKKSVLGLRLKLSLFLEERKNQSYLMRAKLFSHISPPHVQTPPPAPQRYTQQGRIAGAKISQR